jgi:hypothetical protein
MAVNRVISVILPATTADTCFSGFSTLHSLLCRHSYGGWLEFLLPIELQTSPIWVTASGPPTAASTRRKTGINDFINDYNLSHLGHLQSFNMSRIGHL